MGATWKKVVTTKTQVDFEYEIPSTQSHGYGGDVSSFHQVLSQAHREYERLTGKKVRADDEIQLFVGDDKVVFRFWVEKVADDTPNILNPNQPTPNILNPNQPTPNILNPNQPTFSRVFSPALHPNGVPKSSHVRFFVESLPDVILSEVLAQATLEQRARDHKRDTEIQKLVDKNKDDTP
jgi:hypothetical protein